MPFKAPVLSGDSLQSLAQKHLGDASKWRDVANLDSLNPLEALPIGKEINIPTKAEVFKMAAPALQAIGTGLNGEPGQLISNFLDQAQGEIAKALNVIPQAQALLGEINGVLGDVQSVVDREKIDELLGDRGYSQQVNRIIDWLL